MISLITQENLVSGAPIEEGDAGIILKKDGSFKIFNTHGKIDPNNLTERQILQGKQLMVLAAALQLPPIMRVLQDMVEDPKMFDRIYSTTTKPN